jgi:predicted DNA-binding protein (MmcQ/YjbR family)
VALENEDAVPRTELKMRLRSAYDLVFSKLPKKAQEALGKPVK